MQGAIGIPISVNKDVYICGWNSGGVRGGSRGIGFWQGVGPPGMGLGGGKI